MASSAVKSTRAQTYCNFMKFRDCATDPKTVTWAPTSCGKSSNARVSIDLFLSRHAWADLRTHIHLSRGAHSNYVGRNDCGTGPVTSAVTDTRSPSSSMVRPISRVDSFPDSAMQHRKRLLGSRIGIGKKLPSLPIRGVPGNKRLRFVSADCQTEKGIKCQNGACLDSQCHCNDGFGGCGCEMPGNLCAECDPRVAGRFLQSD